MNYTTEKPYKVLSTYKLRHDENQKLIKITTTTKNKTKQNTYIHKN